MSSGALHVRVLKPGSTVARSSLHKIKYPTEIPRWRANRVPPKMGGRFSAQYKKQPKPMLRKRRPRNQEHLRPWGNMMPTTMKYARHSALASFLGYRFPMKFTRDQTLCIYRYYLPPPGLMRVNKGDHAFGGKFPYSEWTFMNHNRLYNAKYYSMFYHLLLKARNQSGVKHGDTHMMLINEGTLLNNYPHPLLPLLRAYMKQQTIEFTSLPDYEAIFHFCLTAMFVPDAQWFLRYMIPYVFYDRRNLRLMGKLLSIASEVKTMHLVQFYDRTFLRKMSYRASYLNGFRKHRVMQGEQRKFLYRQRRPVEDYMLVELPPYEK